MFGVFYFAQSYFAQATIPGAVVEVTIYISWKLQRFDLRPRVEEKR